MHAISDPTLLNDEQRELLAAAAENRGRLSIQSKASTRGKAVCGKHRSFFDAEDRDVAARFIDELNGLEKLLLVREASRRGEFELTNFGWQLSRKLT